MSTLRLGPPRDGVQNGVPTGNYIDNVNQLYTTGGWGDLPAPEDWHNQWKDAYNLLSNTALGFADLGKPMNFAGQANAAQTAARLSRQRMLAAALRRSAGRRLGSRSMSINNAILNQAIAPGIAEGQSSLADLFQSQAGLNTQRQQASLAGLGDTAAAKMALLQAAYQMTQQSEASGFDLGGLFSAVANFIPVVGPLLSTGAKATNTRKWD